MDSFELTVVLTFSLIALITVITLLKNYTTNRLKDLHGFKGFFLRKECHGLVITKSTREEIEGSGTINEK